MNRNTRLALAVSLLLPIVLASQLAIAKENENKNNNQPLGQTIKLLTQERNMFRMMDKNLDAMELRVNADQESAVLRPNGDFTVTGVTVNSVDTSANTATVTLYGFTRTVSVAGATLWGGGKNITLADIKSGDKLIARGNFNSSTRAITVSEVRDASYAAQATSDLQKQIEELRKKLNELQAQLRALRGN
jgi:septal ring factor EnvC (AmiA/AmiB activator)